MPQDAARSRVLAFDGGRVQIDLASRQLAIAGAPAGLGGRAFDLLAALVERRERVVPKKELLDVVWPGSIVEENNLQVHVSALRRLLGPQAIATVPGRGYRFTSALDNAHPPGPSATPVQTPALAPRLKTNLPERLPPLIGRDDDLAALRTLVHEHPLVTISGAGGIGKTLLAQHLLTRQPGEADPWRVLGRVGDRRGPGRAGPGHCRCARPAARQW